MYGQAFKVEMKYTCMSFTLKLVCYVFKYVHNFTFVVKKF